jgi:hypothetical protein
MRIKLGGTALDVHARVVRDSVDIHYTEPLGTGQADILLGTSTMTNAPKIGTTAHTAHVESLEVLRNVVKDRLPELEEAHRKRILAEIAAQQRVHGKPKRRVVVIKSL